MTALNTAPVGGWVVTDCRRVLETVRRTAVTWQDDSRDMATLGQNLGVFPLEQTRHVGVAKSEHPRLTNDEIIFEEFFGITF